MNPDAAQWLEKIAKTGLGWITLNRIRAIVPLLVLQSDKAAELFTKAKGRLAELNAIEQMVQNEVELRNTTRRALIERVVTASPEERVEIEQKLEWLDAVNRQLGISLKSLSYGNNDAESESTKEQCNIQDHWVDRFNELARKRNEDWRAELLARALARETSAPGSVSPRLLWLIGTLEEEAFQAFSALLNVSVWFVADVPNPGPFVPNSEINPFILYTERKVRGHVATIGELHSEIADTSLVADAFTSHKTIRAGAKFVVRHGEIAFRIELKKDVCINGLIFTSLGHSLSHFHEPVWTSTGAKVLQEWAKSIPLGSAKVARLTPAELSAACAFK